MRSSLSERRGSWMARLALGLGEGHFMVPSLSSSGRRYPRPRNTSRKRLDMTLYKGAREGWEGNRDAWLFFWSVL